MIETHISCEDCGSSDGLTDYGDHSYCFVCNKFRRENNGDKRPETITRNVVLQEIDKMKIRAIPDRGIPREAAEKYSVWINDKGEHVYPYFDRVGNHRANKIRFADKKGFLVSGEWKETGLFGQQLFPPGSARTISIVEGELDALSAWEMTRKGDPSGFPVVSVKSASEADKNVADNFEYLNSFPEIVICFDKDDEHVRPDGTKFFPGQEAAVRVAAMFPLGKVRLLTLQEGKDANDYLRAGKTARFIHEWWKAPVWTPVGLKLAKDLRDEVKKTREYETAPYPWNGLQELTYGIRLSEFVLLTADTGVGKTSFVKELEHSLLGSTQRGVGLLHLEESNQDTILGLMSISANLPLHLPDVRKGLSDDDIDKYFDETIKDERVVIWDHFGSNALDEILRTIRHMHNLGCKYIILDHLSILVSDQSGDERKQLDEISTKLKTLCMELNIAVIAVIHQNRRGEIRSSAGPEQLANMVIKLSRDKEDDDDWRRNVTKVVVQKNRFCGRTGPACHLHYDGGTGRLSELDKASADKYENGLTQNSLPANKGDW